MAYFLMLRCINANVYTAIVLLLLTACTSVSVVSTEPYSKLARSHLYALQHWSLEGRLALRAQKEAWSANMDWQHAVDSETIKLSGPLGQGAALIQLTPQQVTIDRGGGHVQTSMQPEQFVAQQLGMTVPIQALRYWVLGLPEPTQDFFATHDGFKQGEWLVEYQEMQQVKAVMPRRMSVTNGKVKLKVIIDQWLINDTAQH